MKEQSHKNEMRAALQGDFERFRARREDSDAPVTIAPPVEEPTPEPDVVEAVAPPVIEPFAVEPLPARSSWLDRLRDRR